MSLTTFIIGSVLLISILSFSGIFLAFLEEKRMQPFLFLLIAFAAGGLIGDVFIHIVPEMAEGEGDFFASASLIVIVGILLSFSLEKIIHWRHSHTTTDLAEHAKPFGIMNLVGDATHNFIDGLLIAGSYFVSIPTGIATTVAVILHEIPQEIGDFAVLLYSGYTKKRAMLFNLLTALTSVVGALLALLLHSSLPQIETYLLPLVAGNFLYIAVADLLPELHKQTRIRDALSQLLAVLAGIILMFLLTFLE